MNQVKKGIIKLKLDPQPPVGPIEILGSLGKISKWLQSTSFAAHLHSFSSTSTTFYSYENQ